MASGFKYNIYSVFTFHANRCNYAVLALTSLDGRNRVGHEYKWIDEKSGEERKERKYKRGDEKIIKCEERQNIFYKVHL